MWKKPWGLTEGILIGGGLVVMGLLLQFSTGGIRWQLFSTPINWILLVVYLLTLCLTYGFRRHIYVVRWAMGYTAVLPAIAYVVVLTLLMGLIKQVPERVSTTDGIGMSRMVSFWPFVLNYIWMTTILGWVCLKCLCSFRWTKLPFLCNHLGLFIALLAATLGSADMQRLTMQTQVGQTEWRAVDAEGKLHELPIAIELEEFTIDEYPPKLMLIDNATGMALPEKKPAQLSLDEGVSAGTLLDWEVDIRQQIEFAASVFDKDTIHYVEWNSLGATYAAYVCAHSSDGLQKKEGWVTCGSFVFPYQALRLDSLCSLVMPNREPKRFASKVKIYTKTEHIYQTEIEVNKPADIEGWKIYQLSYDEAKGRWSDISIFELVSDPWLPIVYSGIVLMILGAICMFVIPQKLKEEKP